jgi:CTP:molybdopterin cytidylyltransferase MocA
VFGPRARARIAGLPDGDTLRALRDDPGLRRVEVPETEDRAFADVDTPEDFARLRAALEPSAPEPGS